jgi:hypothetical protein
MVQFTFEGVGPRGAWQSFCPRCQSYMHYLPAGYDTKGLANFGPQRRPGEYATVPDFLGMEKAAEEERRQRKRAEILDALGLDEADLDALLSTVRAMVKPRKAS